MDIINHQSNGAQALRVAATVCVIIGWIAFIVGFIGGCVSKDLIFFAPFLAGCAGLGVMYLVACCVRALATITEAAQIYKDKHSEAEYAPEYEYAQE